MTTLLYNPQKHAHQYDRACTEHLFNRQRSNSAGSPLIEAGSTDTERDGLNAYPDLRDLPGIIAPCPKKALCAYTGHLLNNNFAQGVVQPENPWGLSAVQEDTEDDGLGEGVPMRLASEVMSDEALAYAELMAIMGNASRGSSRSVSQSGSPIIGQCIHSPDAADQHEPDCVANDVNGEDGLNNDEDNDDSDENIDVGAMSSSTRAIEIDYIRRRSASRPLRLTVDNAHALYGSSPITRANNPLPLDSSFSPTKRQQTQPYPPRPALQQAAMQRKMCDTAPGAHSGARSFDDDQNIALCKTSKAAILLRIHEGGRRRSLSVGSASLKPGSKIRRVC